ncbi:MAG: M20/M25/M40 family metallo-hydrolase [Clostridia bacterium]|jgi:tripeptide aminopeptidase|nr:M20/M25/M40 family metallo-hydrolase [Clostridiales bacterium]
MAEHRIVDEFCELVRIDTASRNEREIADIVKAKLVAIGCRVEEDDAAIHLKGNAGNILAVLEGELEGAILLSAHLDRVANGYGIKPRIDGSRIVSDGTTILAADDISGVVAILDGVRRIKESGKPHPRVEIVFTVCEEKGVSGSKYLNFSKFQSEFGYALDSPGRIGRIIKTAPSKAQLKLEVFGKASHAGNAPEKGVNAIIATARILADIKDGRLDDESTANYAIFRAGGEATNIVCDYALVTGETRSLNHDKLEEYCRYFVDHCKKAVEGTGATVKTDVLLNYKCFNVKEDGKAISLMRRVFKKMGIDMIIDRGGGGMDANRFNANGIECIGLATGYGANHTSNEYVEVDDLIRSGEMVEQMIAQYAEQIKK